MEQIICQKCGQMMDFKSGISKKNNKPYQMWKCSDKNCGNAEFVHSDKPKTPPLNGEVFQGTKKEEVVVPTKPIDDMDKWLLYFQRLEQVLDLFKSKECNAETPLSSAILGLRGLMGI